MLNALQALLLALAGAGSLVRLPTVANGEFLPQRLDLEQRFADPAVRESVVRSYLTEVKGRWDELAFLWINSLSAVHSTHSAMTSSPVQKIETLSKNDVDTFWRLLSLSDVPAAVDLMEMPSIDAAVSHATSSPETAVESVVQLRQLDDVLFRVKVALTAAAQTGIPTSDVLALSRTEGDLAAPRSAWTLDAGILASRGNELFQTIPLDNLTWMAHIVPFGEDMPVSALQLRSMRIWLLQIAGLDWVDRLEEIESIELHGDVGGATPSQKSLFGAWSSRNWEFNAATNLLAHGSQSAAERESVWDSLLANMSVRRVGRDASRVLHSLAPGDALPPNIEYTAWRMAPVDAELLASTALAEGALYLRWIGSLESVLGSLPDGHRLKTARFDQGTSYALYNLQVGAYYDKFPNDRRSPQPKEAMIISALAAASGTRSTRYQDLRETFGSVFLEYLEDNRNDVSRSSATDNLANHWPTVEAWLKGPNSQSSITARNRVALVGDFISSAGTNLWRGWEEPRGNMSRYLRLLDFFRRLA